MLSLSARLLAVALLATSVSACGILGPGQECHTGIFYDVTPEEATLTVGESFQPVATVDSCPEGQRQLHLQWRAEDSSIVDVDPESGETTGLNPGSTIVSGWEEQRRPILDIDVTVVP